jgi:hypothetical protein
MRKPAKQGGTWRVFYPGKELHEEITYAVGVAVADGICGAPELPDAP